MFSLTACLAFLENEKDEEAFLRYYERYHRLVLYEAEKIVGPSAAEDVMQNTFVYIAKHFSTFRSGSSKKVTHLAALCARQARNWTQPYVADSISITLRQYQNIESGRCTPRTDTFLKLVYLFGLDIEKYKKGFILHVPLPAYRK